MSSQGKQKNTRPHEKSDIHLEIPSNGTYRHCPYHASILNLNNPKEKRKDLGIMERFLQEGASEQSAIMYREDTKKLSISKDCHCASGEGKGKERL